MTRPYQQTVEQVISAQDVNADAGLSAAEARRRAQRFGPNRLRRTTARPAWRILIDQLESIVVLLLLGATVATAAMGRLLESAAIGAAVLVNTLIGFGMELRATRAMEALQRMGRVMARVRREGVVEELPADALVPGDVVELEAGDLIPADLRLIETNDLQCDEAPLTGESSAVDKHPDALDADDLPLGERYNMAYKGTAVIQGSGTGVVVATGMDTELGHISRLVEEAEQSLTPLERRLDRLGRRLVWLTVAIAMVVAGAGFVSGKDTMVMLETAIALAIAAVPEGLPVVATLALAHGMRRMARRNAVVKKLSAVEALGAINLIFTDKTGTLTQSHMTLARLALASGTVALTCDDGLRYRLDKRPLSLDDTPTLRAALEAGALCNNASFEDDTPVGDPTEVALLEAAAGAHMPRAELLERYPEAREVSFNPELKMMATFHDIDDGFRVAVKGAPEAVLHVCNRLLTDDGESELDDEDRRRWRERGDELAADGLRVLALAQNTVSNEDAEPYEELILIGLAGLYDPPREGVREAVQACQDAGIRVIMGTGDHPATAATIAREVGLEDTEADATALVKALDESDELDDGTRQRLLECNIFARMSPEQKLNLIAVYQDAGWVVGMTGDGVNDAPALKKADIGIAMGERGTDVAREAADIVLKDDAFATIVAAIDHGRTIFQNIRRFIIYLLSGNLAEVMAVSAAAIVAAPLPMLPLQILYINFVCDVMPALALGLSPGDAYVMRRPPRDPKEPILTRHHWLVITVYGAVIAAAVLGGFATALLVLELDTPHAVTVGFLCFGFARLWHVFNMRDAQAPFLINEITRNRFVWVAIGIGAALLLSATYVPLLAEVLSVHPPGRDAWLTILGFSLLPVIAVQIGKRLISSNLSRRRQHSEQRNAAAGS